MCEGTECHHHHHHHHHHSPELTVAAEPETALPPELLYGNAIAEYARAYGAVDTKVDEKTFDPKSDGELIQALNAADKALLQALYAMVTTHPHGKQALEYLRAGSRFAKRIVTLGCMNIDAYGPKERRETKNFFGAWKAAELSYAALGYRTVTLDEFLQSVPWPGTLHKATYGLLFVNREEGEERILHSVELQKTTPKLKI